MKQLAVIVPYVQEWPQIAFTLRSIHEDLLGIDHEIIVVDNFCEQAYIQTRNMGTVIDRGHSRVELPDKTIVPTWLEQEGKFHQSAIEAQAERLPWLRYIHYDMKLSHWNSKRVACKASDAEVFLFADSHVVPGRDSLRKLYDYYSQHWYGLTGSLHLPLSYHILEEHRLIYKLVYERGLLGYSFTGYRDEQEPYEVPVMSTCGMMIHRNYLDRVGGWPRELGIYGGGENFMNASMAVTGLRKWIMPGTILHHHGDKRGYHYEWLDHKRNQAIAMFLAAGRGGLMKYLEHVKGFERHHDLFMELADEIMTFCAAQRGQIVENTEIELEEWVSKWTK